MPELPEVETIVRGLRDKLVGDKITRIVVREEKLIGFPTSGKFKKYFSRQREIIALNRRGKYILMELPLNKLLVIHLRMTGKLLLKNSAEDTNKHTHIIFYLTEERKLCFNNIRKFGRLYLIDKNHREQAGGLDELGPEPLGDQFTKQDFKSLLENRRGKIKPLLLNQKFLAGLGNIYTDEALFIAQIAPERKADTLSEEEMERLYAAIRQTLLAGIKYCGTSVSDYVNSRGETGQFQEKLQVYQQDGSICPKCAREIKKKKVGGRGTHFCPNCQK